MFRPNSREILLTKTYGGRITYRLLKFIDSSIHTTKFRNLNEVDNIICTYETYLDLNSYIGLGYEVLLDSKNNITKKLLDSSLLSKQN